MPNKDYENSPSVQTGVRAKSVFSQSVHCHACNKDFADEDELLEHVYDSDSCYKAHLAMDRKEMGKE
jgi:hypothetical protein